MSQTILLPNNYLQKDKCLIFLVMAYMSVMLSSGILTSKLIMIGSLVTFAGAIVAPFWFLISDMIAELYGPGIAKTILWYSFFCQLLFSIICVLLTMTNSPSYWHGQEAYDFVTGSLIRVTLSAFVAYMISGRLNIYLLTNSKLFISGKSFWARSIFASLLGEGLFTILAVTMIQLHKSPFEIIVKIILTSYSIKIACSLIFSIPVSIIVHFIKKYNR